MIAVLICLASLLMLLTSVSLARPVRRAASMPPCSLDQPSMPDLKGLILQGSPRVIAKGRLIKGLYYSDGQDGSNSLAAFFIACDRLLEPRPFLVTDFRTSRFSFDGDRDGCSDASGRMPRTEIDPADFLPSVDRAEEICEVDTISQGRLDGLASLQEAGSAVDLWTLESLGSDATVDAQ